MSLLESKIASKLGSGLFAVAKAGLAQQTDIVRVEFADDATGGQSKVETVVATIPVFFEERPSARQDEGGKWQSYVRNTALMPVIYEGNLVDLRLTDILRTETGTEYQITVLSKPQNVIFELSVERDERAGQRINGV